MPWDDDREWLECQDCINDDCECGAGWYDDDGNDDVVPECPCCGSQDCQP